MFFSEKIQSTQIKKFGTRVVLQVLLEKGWDQDFSRLMQILSIFFNSASKSVKESQILPKASLSTRNGSTMSLWNTGKSYWDRASNIVLCLCKVENPLKQRWSIYRSFRMTNLSTFQGRRTVRTSTWVLSVFYLRRSIYYATFFWRMCGWVISELYVPGSWGKLSGGGV